MAILALVSPSYTPAMRIISTITNANPASVTTTFNHGYLTGLIVRIDLPPLFGMQQLGKLGQLPTLQTFEIIVTGNTTFTIPIDTTNFDAFSTPSNFPYKNQSAQVVPVGEDTALLTSAVVNTLVSQGQNALGPQD